MKYSKIEWCNHTFNPWEGCAKVSAGCAHCYAEARNARFGGGTAPNWGKGAPRRRTIENYWDQPLKWDREAKDAIDRLSVVHGVNNVLNVWQRPRVFCASLADWLDGEVPIEWLADLMGLIRNTPHLDWLLLTKRPENWTERIQRVTHEVGTTTTQTYKWLLDWQCGRPPLNVWMGTTAESQACANSRTKELLKIPAKIRFLSCEPLLGPINLTDLSFVFGSGYNALAPYRSIGSLLPPEPKIDWVIGGGESGPEARPMHPDWARALRDQCAKHGTPFLFKQWGEHVDLGNMPPETVEKQKFFQPLFFEGHEAAVYHVGKKNAGRTLDGRLHDAYPEVKL